MSDNQNNITVDVKVDFLNQESSADAERYLFSYAITLKNKGAISARLLSRYWEITDAKAHRRRINGDGVIGLHPHLKPGQEFTYVSSVMLETPVGMMEGHYIMITDDGEKFEVAIPAFSLAVPQRLH